MEILNYLISEKEAEYIIEENGVEKVISIKFDLEETSEPAFDPGSLYGYYEKNFRKSPIDLEFSPDISQVINDCIEEHLLDYYDSDNF